MLTSLNAYFAGRIRRVVHKGGEHKFGMANAWVRFNWCDFIYTFHADINILIIP